MEISAKEAKQIVSSCRREGRCAYCGKPTAVQHSKNCLVKRLLTNIRQLEQNEGAYAHRANDPRS